MNRPMRSPLAVVALLLAGAPPAVLAQTPRYVYLAPTSSAWGGSGSYADPYEVGTVQKFDTVVSNLLWRATTNLTLTLMPGTYWTRGSDAGTNGWRVQPGSVNVRFRGAGQGVSILNLTNASLPTPRAAVQFGRPNALPVRGCTVELLTIDAGSHVTGVSGGGTLGVALYGFSNAVERVTVTNLRSSPATQALGILLTATNATAAGNLVEWCDVRGLRDANATGISVLGHASRVANCTVDFGPQTGLDARNTAGLAFAGADCLFMANTVSNVQWGVRSATGAKTNALANNVFFANSFQGHQAAFSWNLDAPTNLCPAWLFSENTFFAPRASNYWLQAWCPSAPAATNTHPGWKFVRNNFTGVSTNGLAHRDGADWIYFYNRFDREPKHIFGGRRIAQYNEATNGVPVMRTP